MKKALCFLAAGSISLATAQVHVAGNGSSWSLDPNGQMMWNGTPYQPVGLRVAGTPAAVEAASQSGAKDILIELPSDGPSWAPVIAAAEKHKLRYMITISSMAPICEGMAIEPETYRIPGIKEPKFIEFPLDADWALSALVFTRDSAINQTHRSTMKSGFFSEQVDPKGAVENLLLIYPHTKQQRIPDFWSSFDGYRDQLLRHLVDAKVGPGFRGIVNPLGETMNFPQSGIKFVPTDVVFQTEMEAALAKKYASVSTAIKSWSVSTADFETFKEMARMIPLWSENRGISQLWDPVRETFYPVETKRSTAWKDIQDVIRNSARRRYGRLVDAIQTIANVPVIQDWHGWTGPYSDADTKLAGLGVQMSTSKPLGLVEDLARAGVSSQRWTNPGWVIATRVQSNEEDFNVSAAMKSASELGVKGWFIPQTAPKAGEWLKDALATTAVGARFKATPYPEASNNPAYPQSLPNGSWWAPAPGDGNRVDFGSHYDGYIYQDGLNNFVAIWSKDVRRRVRMYVDDPKTVTAESTDGSDPQLKIVKKQVELTLGTLPTIIRGCETLPVPEDSLSEALDQWQGLKDNTSKGFTILSEDANMVQDAIQAFDRSPGPSYQQIRESLNRLNKQVAAFIWIEAESPKTHTFSEIDTTFGCSGNKTIRLMSRMPSDLYEMQATYQFMARVAGEHQVWLAAKIPPSDAKYLVVMVGDQVYRINGKPESLYCDGYGWYNLGTVQLQKNEPQTARIKAVGAKQVDISIDSLVLSPETFRPNGPKVPNVLPSVPAKGKKKK